MRIISSFQDYYDSAMGLGQDRTRVFQREQSEDHNTSFRYHCGMPNLQYPGDRGKWHTIGASSYLLFFCGKLYPFYGRDAGGEHIYSFEKGFSVVSKTQRPLSVRQPWDKRKQTTNDWQKWLSDNTGKAVDEVNLQFESPIVLLSFLPNISANDRTLHINPEMRCWRLQKLIDPFTAFQELDMYLGTTLVRELDPCVKMTDKEKILSHGLDPKYGFRKMPSQ